MQMFLQRQYNERSALLTLHTLILNKIDTEKGAKSITKIKMQKRKTYIMFFFLFLNALRSVFEHMLY